MTKSTSFALEPADAMARNLAWRLHNTWSDCITFDAEDKNTFRHLVAGQPVDALLVVRFLHHALAKAATRKGQSMARRQIVAPLQEIAALVEHMLASNVMTDGVKRDVAAADPSPAIDWDKVLVTSPAAITFDANAAIVTFMETKLDLGMRQRLADFRAGMEAVLG